MSKTVYLITGATRGLGEALLATVIADGGFVVGCGRSKDQIERLQSTYTEDVAELSVVDVSDAAAVAEWAEQLVDKGLVPNVLVNNAGTINENAPLWEVSDEEFTRVFDVNVRGTANIIRSFLPAMLESGEGAIVNFSSGWGRSTSPEVAPYCASKWAIEGLSQALAQELPEGFCCVALNPGVINTAMLQSCFGGEASEYQLPEEWVTAAYKRIKGLGPRHNGQALSV